MDRWKFSSWLLRLARRVSVSEAAVFAAEFAGASEISDAADTEFSCPCWSYFQFVLSFTRSRILHVDFCCHSKYFFVCFQNRIYMVFQEVFHLQRSTSHIFGWIHICLQIFQCQAEAFICCDKFQKIIVQTILFYICTGSMES